jgi:hypothetical protein
VNRKAEGPDGETVLTGPAIDQAALHGFLNSTRDLGHLAMADYLPGMELRVWLLG